MSGQESGSSSAGNQNKGASGDPFQLMAQGLGLIRQANDILHDALRQQEQRISEAMVQQEQRINEALRQREQRISESLRQQDAVQEATRIQEERLEGKIDEVKQAMDAKIARVSEAVCNLTLAVNEGLRRAGERADALESKLPPASASTRGRGDDDALEQLEGRMKNLEASVQKALQSVFPRVDALVCQLEHQGDSQEPASKDVPASSTAASVSGSGRSGSPRPSSVTPTTPTSRSASETERVGSGKDLCKAAENADVDEVRRLLGSGAVAVFTDPDGWTPLHWAARNAHAEMVALLLDRDADVNARDSDGDTPLHLAALYDRVGQCVFLLIDAGACVDCSDKNGETPLGWASNAENVAAVRLLKAASAKEARGEGSEEEEDT